MVVQELLIIVLLVCVLVLLAALYLRGRRQRRVMQALGRLDLPEFASLLNTNSKDGVIAAVARGISDQLRSSLGCDVIVFLRKKRGTLKFNFGHGLGAGRHNEFNIPFSKELAEQLRSDFLPKSIASLRGAVGFSDTVWENLTATGVDTFFPIFWRENLYGVYFIRSTLDTRSPSFHLLVAGLAQCLSSAYHIKWHEMKQEDLTRRLENLSAEAECRVSGGVCSGSVLKLIRHRRSETLMPRLLQSIKEDLGLSGVAYAFQVEGDSDQPQVIQEGLSQFPASPSAEEFRRTFGTLGQQAARSLERGTTEREPNGDWWTHWRECGLKYAASFAPHPVRAGVLAWSGGRSARAVQAHLVALRDHAGNLLENARSYEEIEEMSYTDGLTGLANRRFFFKRLDEETSRAKRYGRSLALILFDLDQLKVANDTYGHLAGDAILRQMGGILGRSIRSVDIVARYGGDEFCVIMPEADRDICRKFMIRLQSAISRTRFLVDGVEGFIKCTVSIGGAIFPEDGEESRKLLHAADMALLKAKDQGRNMALLFGED